MVYQSKLALTIRQRGRSALAFVRKDKENQLKQISQRQNKGANSVVGSVL